ncbi:MAG: transaldolase, partial [Candidatus Omnitrophota bacterium]
DIKQAEAVNPSTDKTITKFRFNNQEETIRGIAAARAPRGRKQSGSDNMFNTKMGELAELGQSVWLDYISRPLLQNGRLKELVDMGLRGVTSNPTIFDKAISGSGDYDQEIKRLSRQGLSCWDIYDNLTAQDIRAAADIFSRIYEDSNGRDGYVSLEVNPELSDKTEETVKEGLRLNRRVGRANLMLKVPATQEGVAVIEELVARGINVNATLIFSCSQYAQTADAYIKGLMRLAACGGDVGRVHSVASVFVSRIDTAVDNMLGGDVALQGRAAVANSAIIYAKYREIFSSPAFTCLKRKGANLQRVLWASTGTKNPNYSDTKYVRELIARDTVNTMPEKTLQALLENGEASLSLDGNDKQAREIVTKLSQRGIDIDNICNGLLRDGIKAFRQSFASLLASIKQRMSCGG